MDGMLYGAHEWNKLAYVLRIFVLKLCGLKLLMKDV